MQGNDPGSNATTRRTALKTLGTATLGALTPTVVSTAAAKSGERVLVSLRRPQANPLGVTDLVKAQKRAVKRAKNRFDIDKAATFRPESVGSKDIVAVVFAVEPDGTIQSYFGTAANRPGQNVAELHANADTFETELDAQGGSGQVETASSDPSYEWTHVGSASWEHQDKPYGIVYNGTDLHHYDDDPSYDVFGSELSASYEPGEHVWDNGYYWAQAASYNHWGRYYEPGGAILHDYAPSGDRDGDYTVSASAGYATASISVSYNPPEIYRYDESSNLNDNARWRWESVDDGQPHSPNTTSIMKSENFASQGDTLMGTDARLRFYDDYSIGTSMTTTWE